MRNTSVGNALQGRIGMALKFGTLGADFRAQSVVHFHKALKRKIIQGQQQGSHLFTEKQPAKVFQIAAHVPPFLIIKSLQGVSLNEYGKQFVIASNAGHQGINRFTN